MKVVDFKAASELDRLCHLIYSTRLSASTVEYLVLLLVPQHATMGIFVEQEDAQREAR